MSAKTAFILAIESSDYTWAKQFYAILLTLGGDYAEALNQLSVAPTNYSELPQPLRRSISLLSRFQAFVTHDGGDTTQREWLENSVAAGQSIVVQDPEDYHAVYSVAASNLALAQNSSGYLTADEAQAVANYAIGVMANTIIRALSFMYVLNHSIDINNSSDTVTNFVKGLIKLPPESGLFATAEAKKQSALDPETLAILHHEPLLKDHDNWHEDLHGFFAKVFKVD
jgi:hypothetical protein